jgi:tripartite ATP-independent transporter DctP family solute receptor
MGLKSVITAAVFALAATVASGAYAQNKIVIKVPSGHADPKSIHVQGIQKIGEELEALMPGVFDFQFYPGGQLGQEREVLEGVRLGTIEMTSSGVLGVVDPRFDVFDMPFLFSSRDHVYSVLDGEIGQNMLANIKDPKLVGLGYFENGWRHITNNKRPIEKPEDLRGLKQRVVEHQVYLATMRALGASAVPIPYGELYTALRSGVVDGQDNPLTNIHSAKFYEVQKYLTLSQHVYSNQVILGNRAWFDKLTPEQQAAVRTAVARATEFQRKASIASDKELIDTLGKSMQVNDIKDRQPFIDATKTVYEQFAEKYPPELIKRIREAPVKDYPYAD